MKDVWIKTKKEADLLNQLLWYGIGESNSYLEIENLSS